MKLFCCFRKKNKLIGNHDKNWFLDQIETINVFVTEEEERVTDMSNPSKSSYNISTLYDNNTENEERMIIELMNSIVESIEKK